MITESLGTDYKAQELGFMSVVSVEPIIAWLSHHNILLEIQKEGWDGFWDYYYSLEDLNLKKDELCYWCGKLATSREHVPPESLFPENKDIKMISNYSYRYNLITVPSCDEHNMSKS